MANFEVAFTWMMLNEDSQRQYATVPDVGFQAISGINSKSFPDQFATINAIPQAQRGPAVEQFYMVNFWNPWFGQIISDEVAKRVFDAAVNMGSSTAVKILQIACNSLLTPLIAQDGAWGPATVHQVNDAAPDALVSAYIAARRAHYVDIIRVKPELSRYLAAWLARASK